MEYNGKGPPHIMCMRCRELNVSGRICPCGQPLPKGRRRYCSTRCASERKLKVPKTPRLATEMNHATGAKVLAAWMCLRGCGDIAAKRDSLWAEGEMLFVVRRTRVAFGGSGGLPREIAVDDVERFESASPKHGYLLLSKRMDAAVNVPTDSARRPYFRVVRQWSPRLKGWAETIVVPKSITKSFQLHIPGIAP